MSWQCQLSHEFCCIVWFALKTLWPADLTYVALGNLQCFDAFLSFFVSVLFRLCRATDTKFSTCLLASTPAPAVVLFIFYRKGQTRMGHALILGKRERGRCLLCDQHMTSQATGTRGQCPPRCKYTPNLVQKCAQADRPVTLPRAAGLGSDPKFDRADANEHFCLFASGHGKCLCITCPENVSFLSPASVQLGSLISLIACMSGYYPGWVEYYVFRY
jgi:hypothetical protein